MRDECNKFKQKSSKSLKNQTLEGFVEELNIAYFQLDMVLETCKSILEFVKFDRGSIFGNQVKFTEFDLEDLCLDVMKLFESQIEFKKLYLDLEYPESAVRLIKSDPVKLRQILINLVANALKYTQNGGVTIQIEEIVCDSS